MTEFEPKDKKQMEKSTQPKRARPAYHQLKQEPAPEGDHQNGAEAILQIQQTYGNRYLQRLAETSKETIIGKDIVRRIEAQRASGRPLEPEVRSQMEPFFKHNFGQVRIHNDSESSELCRELGARAFTVGQDIFLKDNGRSPNSADGTKLIVHELTHVVQQSNAVAPSTLAVTHPSQASETEARKIEGEFPTKECAIQESLSPGLVARDNGEGEEPDEAVTQQATQTYWVAIRIAGSGLFSGSLERMITLVRNHVEAAAEAHQHFVQHIHTPVIADIADFFGGVSLPPVGMWNRPRYTLARAGQFLAAGRHREAYQLLEQAVEEYNDRYTQWYNYREGTVRGGERTVTGLEITSAVLISVGATVGTAGLAPTAGLLTEALITSGIAMGETALFGGARELSEMGMGIDEEWNWDRYLTDIITNGATTFIGSCISGALKPVFERAIASRTMSLEVYQALREVFELGNYPFQLPPPTAWSVWVNAHSEQLGRLIAQLPSGIVNAALTTVAELFRQTGPPRNAEEFLQAFVDTLFENWRDDIISEVLAIFLESAVPPGGH